MPESFEANQVANFSINIKRREKSPESEDDKVLESDVNADESYEIQDIGELLGFRITGGRDFFMPITIFHVNIITNTCHRQRLTDLSCLR